MNFLLSILIISGIVAAWSTVAIGIWLFCLIFSVKKLIWGITEKNTIAISISILIILFLIVLAIPAKTLGLKPL